MEYNEWNLYHRRTNPISIEIENMRLATTPKNLNRKRRRWPRLPTMDPLAVLMAAGAILAATILCLNHSNL